MQGLYHSIARANARSLDFGDGDTRVKKCEKKSTFHTTMKTQWKSPLLHYRKGFT